MEWNELCQEIETLIRTGHNNVSWYELNKDVQELLNDYYEGHGE
jgi:hypothetical protein